jgi:hypothetical protein
MTESICGIFLTGFLAFYSTMSVVLLYGVIRDTLRGRLKGLRAVKIRQNLKALAFPPTSQQRKTKSHLAPG